MSFIDNSRINLGCCKSFVTEKPIFAAWHITYRCNLQCKFCSFWKNEYDREREYTVADFHRSIPKLLAMGIRVVNFAGGEPCIREDLPKISSKFAKDFIVIINTNGMHITHEYARALWDAGVDIVNVSLDFFDKEKHNYFRGSDKSYDKALEAMNILRETRTGKQRVAMQSILSPHNIKEFEDMVRLARDMGVDFTFNPYRFGDHESDLSFQNADLGFLYELKKKYENFMATKYALERTEEFVEKGCTGRCGMGKYMIAIDPYGNVGPCENMIQLKAGNIGTDSHREISKRLLEIYEDNGCNKCYTRERSEVEPLYEKIGSPGWIREAMLVRKS